jgi:hypothetical protein
MTISAYNFLQGTTAKWLEERLLRGLKDTSIFNYRPVANISWNKIRLDGERFLYADGENIYYMFAYKSKYATLRWNDLPRFHTEHCRTRVEFPNYDYGSHMPVNIFCSERRVNLGPQRLKFCRNCNRERNFFRFGTQYETWDEVVIGIAAEKTKTGYLDSEIRGDGYTMDWQHVSYAVRAQSNFTCKSCSVRLVDDNLFYLEVHHKDYNRKNNAKSNLDVLCVECHSKVDSQHTLNYARGEAKRKLAAFRMRFRPG